MTMMNRRSLLAAGCAAAALSCAPAALLAAAPAYQVIRPEEARRMMERGGVVVLDVRTPEEFATGHIKGAVNVPVDAIRPGMRLPFSPNPDTPVLIYCRTGRRAGICVRGGCSSGRHVHNFGHAVALWSSSAKSCGRFASYYNAGGSGTACAPFFVMISGFSRIERRKAPCTHAF